MNAIWKQIKQSMLWKHVFNKPINMFLLSYKSLRQFFAYCEPNEPIYLCEERILALQPNSSITQQTDSGYDDDNQPLESTLCSSWSDGQRYFSSMKSLHGGLKTDKIHPLAQCKCSRLGTSSLEIWRFLSNSWYLHYLRCYQEKSQILQFWSRFY